MAGCRYISVTPGRRSNSVRSIVRRDPTCVYTKWSGNTTPSSSATRRYGKPIMRSPLAPAMRSGRPKSTASLEVHVEEVGAELHRAHVAVEVRHVEAPVDRPLDLGPALLAHLVEVGVVPDVVGCVRGKPPSPSRRLGECVIGPHRYVSHSDVQREVDADVLAAVHRRRVARPRARHHQRRAGRDAVAERFVHRDVRRPRRAEVVAVDDRPAWHRPRSRAVRQEQSRGEATRSSRRGARRRAAPRPASDSGMLKIRQSMPGRDERARPRATTSSGSPTMNCSSKSSPIESRQEAAHARRSRRRRA